MADYVHLEFGATQEKDGHGLGEEEHLSAGPFPATDGLPSPHDESEPMHHGEQMSLAAGEASGSSTGSTGVLGLVHMGPKPPVLPGAPETSKTDNKSRRPSRRKAAEPPPPGFTLEKIRKPDSKQYAYTLRDKVRVAEYAMSTGPECRGGATGDVVGARHASKVFGVDRRRVQEWITNIATYRQTLAEQGDHHSPSLSLSKGRAPVTKRIEEELRDIICLHERSQTQLSSQMLLEELLRLQPDFQGGRPDPTDTRAVGRFMNRYQCWLKRFRKRHKFDLQMCPPTLRRLSKSWEGKLYRLATMTIRTLRTKEVDEVMVDVDGREVVAGTKRKVDLFPMSQVWNLDQVPICLPFSTKSADPMSQPFDHSKGAGFGGGKDDDVLAANDADDDNTSLLVLLACSAAGAKAPPYIIYRGWRKSDLDSMAGSKPAEGPGKPSDHPEPGGASRGGEELEGEGLMDLSGLALPPSQPPPGLQSFERELAAGVRKGYPEGVQLSLQPDCRVDHIELLKWIRQVWRVRPGSSVTPTSLLLLEDCRTTRAEEVMALFKECNTTPVHVPASMTNKALPLARMGVAQEMGDRLLAWYNEWRETQPENEAGTPPTPPRPLLAQWVKQAWEAVQSQPARQAFADAGLMLTVNGAADEQWCKEQFGEGWEHKVLGKYDKEGDDEDSEMEVENMAGASDEGLSAASGDLMLQSI